jgi:hypothetical protein
MKKYILLFLTIALFASCSDWLDVTSKDKMLEKDMFSTEANINNAANGLYREMASADLYGGNLSQTTVEMMGHVYAYPPSQPNQSSETLSSWALANYSYYANDDIKKRFSNIWKNAYATLLHINTFIKNVNESPAIMPESGKNIMLGEAYGLRAYIHFDLFRLYGPAWQNKTNSKVLFYNNKTQVVLNHIGYEEAEYSTADEYMTLLLEDIATAEKLLKDNDPIVTDGGSITNELLNDDYYLRNRNRRMNYYAVKGLEARVRQYRGETELAAAAAKEITDQVGNNKRFKMVDPPKMIDNQDYIFFSEVIFGINNLDMYSHADDWYMTTEMREAYVVDKNNFEINIMGYSGSAIGSMPDWRDRQWKESNVINYAGANYSYTGNFVSKKYLFTLSNSKIPAIEDLQVLMRISEMYYIQAEAALKAGDLPTATDLLNTILRSRGLTEQYFLDDSKTEAELRAHIEKEYYREFIGEGQIFFFHKRVGSTRMFKGYDEGTDAVLNGTESFVVPIPEDETNI